MLLLLSCSKIRNLLPLCCLLSRLTLKGAEKETTPRNEKRSGCIDRLFTVTNCPEENVSHRSVNDIALQNLTVSSKNRYCHKIYIITTNTVHHNTPILVTGKLLSTMVCTPIFSSTPAFVRTRKEHDPDGSCSSAPWSTQCKYISM